VVVLDIDDCASFPCGFDNDCFDKVNGYDCSCTAGYVLDNTSTGCIGLIRAARNEKSFNTLNFLFLSHGHGWSPECTSLTQTET